MSLGVYLWGLMMVGGVAVLKDKARCLPLGIDDGGGCGGIEG